jgi:predicted glycoside hydrolase/deacetylase ChbG (UPF0249 family)
MTKYLIINADDFGMSPVFNRIILDLIRDKQISSTSVMVNRTADSQKEQFDELLHLKKNQDISVGLHIEFRTSEYAAQISSQHNKFQVMFSSDPSHVDIHRSRDHRESFADVAKLCQEINVPFRNRGQTFAGVKATEPAFTGTVDDFIQIQEWIQTLEHKKYYEILFHPGAYDPNCTSSLNKDRERDLAHIIKLNAILQENDIRLISYLDLAVAS